MLGMKPGEAAVLARGAQAYMDGASLNDNPYEEGTEENVWWEEAFIAERNYWNPKKT